MYYVIHTSWRFLAPAVIASRFPGYCTLPYHNTADPSAPSTLTAVYRLAAATSRKRTLVKNSRAAAPFILILLLYYTNIINIIHNTYTALRGVCDHDSKNDIIYAGTRPIYTHHRCSKLVSPPPLRYLYTVRGGIWLLL